MLVACSFLYAKAYAQLLAFCFCCVYLNGYQASISYELYEYGIRMSVCVNAMHACHAHVPLTTLSATNCFFMSEAGEF